ncbi:hypothetical protein [Streptomyces pinistramenti]|uniref:hypothetical protein n=1 Tax=Streptomyces pinistramenti TaxID=2884812 RepID=UPI001D097D1E|nr:hypothetical protein [Streptomyces pinistramenti]MCB5910388.1 hypothetical protein [Streptomyces pinistramenti]
MRTTRTRTSIRNRVCALFIVGGIVLTATSCSSTSAGTGVKPTPTKTTGSKPSPVESLDPQAAGKQEVLDSYSKFWTEQAKAYAHASVVGTDLKKYATADALSRAEGDIASLKRLGVVTEGKPESSAKVTSITLEKKVPQATITDCLDISHWKQVEKKTGKEVARGKQALGRYITVVSAEKWGKQWMILKVDTQQLSC